MYLKWKKYLKAYIFQKNPKQENSKSQIPNSKSWTFYFPLKLISYFCFKWYAKSSFPFLAITSELITYMFDVINFGGFSLDNSIFVLLFSTFVFQKKLQCLIL